jgi:2-oxoglutarate/2-oxoacid ferredoxin oxidoreductase subunit alpha
MLTQEKEQKNSKKTVKFMQGNEACVEGAIAAGLSFYAGYPITPSTEIAERLSWRLPECGKIFIQMEDEIASMAAIIGASLGGAKAMTATSGPGFSLMQEGLGFAAMAEVPCLIVDVQRLGPSTGQPSSPSQGDVMQARWGTHGDHPIIALSPSSVKETFDLTIEAFNLAEIYRTPVILLMDEVIGHMRERIEIPPFNAIKRVERQAPNCAINEYAPFANCRSAIPPLANYGEGFRYHVTGLSHDKYGFPVVFPQEITPWFEYIFDKIDRDLDKIFKYQLYEEPGAKTLIISYGASARSSMAAQRLAKEQGLKVSFLKLLTIWPFNELFIKNLAEKYETILVPEMNLGQLILEIKRAAGDKATVKGINKSDGEMIPPEWILDKLG